MSKPYITYIAEVEDLERSNEDTVVYKAINDTITFEELERHKNCINWNYISNSITKEACTRDFYTKFDKHLNWRTGNFLTYVDEDYLLKKIYNIDKFFLFANRKNVSEDFCIKVLKQFEDMIYEYNGIIKHIVSYVKNLSNDFIEKYVLDKIQEAKSKDTCYTEISACHTLAQEVAFKHRITEEQFLKYVNDNNNEYFTKFLRFVILTQSFNNFSKEFIKSNKRNLNEKSFLDTNQVRDYLAEYTLSNNALEIFKSRINYIDLLNKYNLDVKHLEYMVPICKKELFDLFIKHSDKVKSDKKLSELGKLLSK